MSTDPDENDKASVSDNEFATTRALNRACELAAPMAVDMSRSLGGLTAYATALMIVRALETSSGDDPHITEALKSIREGVDARIVIVDEAPNSPGGSRDSPDADARA